MATTKMTGWSSRARQRRHHAARWTTRINAASTPRYPARSRWTLGPLRLDVGVVGKGTFSMVSTNIMLPTDFLPLSEGTTLRASIEFDYESLDLRGGDLVEELMRGVPHSFGLNRMPD